MFELIMVVTLDGETKETLVSNHPSISDAMTKADTLISTITFDTQSLEWDHEDYSRITSSLVESNNFVYEFYIK